MKITLCVFGILCFAGQLSDRPAEHVASGISAEPIVYEFQSHRRTGRRNRAWDSAQDIMEQSMNVSGPRREAALGSGHADVCNALWAIRRACSNKNTRPRRKPKSSGTTSSGFAAT